MFLFFNYKYVYECSEISIEIIISFIQAMVYDGLLSKRTSHQNVPLRKVKTYPGREVKTYSCYKSKRTSTFPYNINILLDIIHCISFRQVSYICDVPLMNPLKLTFYPQTYCMSK